MNRGKLRGIAVAGAMSAALAQVASGVTATAPSAIEVDVRGGTAVALSPAGIGYSPAWGGVTDAGAYVELLKVEHPGTANAVTSTVATCAADAEGDCPYAVGAERIVRFIHRVHAAGGAETGETLVRDVAFGWRGVAAGTAVADTRAASLREAVAARGATPVALTYDTGWATNGVPALVAIKALALTGEGGVARATNSVFAAAADAVGEAPLSGIGAGWVRLICQVSDASGNVLLEYATGDFLLKDFATVIMMR